MGRTRIKICGVRDAETARVAAEAGADAIGLVFVPASPRFITLSQARKIVAALPAFVEPIGLFVDAPLSRVRQIARTLGLRTVQLHGRETPAYAARLSPLRVIKGLAFADAVEAAEELTQWQRNCPNLAAVLWDAPPPTTAGKTGLTGGTGRTVDWKGLARLRQLVGPPRHRQLPEFRPPFILAGGLTPGNVARAIIIVRPLAVDVSSGVEASRGAKDPALIRAFCANVRRTDAHQSRGG